MKLVYLFFLSFVFLKSFGAPDDTVKLKPKPIYGKEAMAIANILDNYHYRKIKLSDSLSSSILDAYCTELDNSKLYFLESDIKSFEKFRFIIDDQTRAGSVQPAYEIYNIFKLRYKERMDFAINKLIKNEFDYSSDEYYESDREKSPWASSMAELDDLWRKAIKNQALSLKLAGKKQPEIYETLKKRYERSLKSILQFTSEDVFNTYMNAITEAYDPHTNYLSPKATDLFNQQMRLSFEGIGALLQIENDYVKVANIIPGGPAEKSNKIHNNDYIIGVAQGLEGDMVDVVGWRIDEVVKLIKGPKNTAVRLSLLPTETGISGPSKEITLIRDKIKLEDQAAKKATYKFNSNGRELKLGVITLPSFYMDFEAYQKGDPDYRSTTRDVKRLIDSLKKEGVSGIAIDLRNNGGGSLSEAIDLTGLFIKNGPVVQVRNSDNKVQLGEDDDNQVFYNGPLVVLTNRFSASASEIFAGAIQDYRRGVIVGESTYGKGTVQTVLDLKKFIQDKENVGDLKLTFQKFYRVTGSSTQNKGVTPDVNLPSAFDAKQYGESSNASALPWDVISSASFQKSGEVNEKILAAINKNYQERLKTDLLLKKYIEDTEDLKKNLSITKISLNEAKRKSEMLEAASKKPKNEKLDTKIKSIDGIVTQDVSKLEDEFLREGILVLADLLLKKIG
jgi:carboxyl-terminal processing protease